MGKDPAVLFYTSDFLTGTILLSWEDKGKYISILCAQHQIFPEHFPEEYLISILGSLENPVFKKFKKDPEGKYFNVKMEEAIKARIKHSNYQKERALKGWENRKKESRKNAPANAPAMPLENENGIEKENGNGIGIGNKQKKPLKESEETFEEAIIFPFDSPEFLKRWEIWKYYKKKEHKFTYKSNFSEQAALTKLDNLSGHDEEISFEIITQSIANGWKGLFNLDKNGKYKQGTTNAELFEIFKRDFEENGGRTN